MPFMGAMSARAGFLRDRTDTGTTRPTHLVQIDMILIDADDGHWQAVGTPAELTATLLNLPPLPPSSVREGRGLICGRAR